MIHIKSEWSRSDRARVSAVSRMSWNHASCCWLATLAAVVGEGGCIPRRLDDLGTKPTAAQDQAEAATRTMAAVDAEQAMRQAAAEQAFAAAHSRSDELRDALDQARAEAEEAVQTAEALRRADTAQNGKPAAGWRARGGRRR